MTSPQGRPRRLLWIVNHKALIPAEVPLFRELGYEVFIPKIIPGQGPFRSGAVTWEHDATLTIPPAALTVLNDHPFYERSWSPTLRAIINAHFEVAVVSFSSFVTPLAEAVHHFHGQVMARIFGREHPQRYADVLRVTDQMPLLEKIDAMGKRFIFAQGYSNLAEIEPSALVRNPHTITLPLPPDTFNYAESWRGTGGAAIFLCPSIQATGYYRDLYETIKRDFGDLPHQIFGRQVEEVRDPNVIPYLSEAELFALYADAPVFVYPSLEPRHIHYSPIEAMVVGTPVLYRRGALTDTLAGGADLPGACADAKEMHDKAKRLLGGDKALAEAIRGSQSRIVDTFHMDRARRQWAEVLGESA
jgi:hypothetical protein